MNHALLREALKPLPADQQKRLSADVSHMTEMAWIESQIYIEKLEANRPEKQAIIRQINQLLAKLKTI